MFIGEFSSIAARTEHLHNYIMEDSRDGEVIQELRMFKEVNNAFA